MSYCREAVVRTAGVESASPTPNDTPVHSTGASLATLGSTVRLRVRKGGRSTGRNAVRESTERNLLLLSCYKRALHGGEIEISRRPDSGCWECNREGAVAGPDCAAKPGSVMLEFLSQPHP